MESQTIIARRIRPVYSLSAIQDEVRQLVERGSLTRQQRIYDIYQYIPPREWGYLECELEKGEYLLRDSIGDLLGMECWENDY